MTFGHKNLSFIRIGLPQEDQKGYIFLSGNLLNMPHMVVSDKAALEAVDVEGLVTLKEEVFKRLGNENV